MQGVYKTVDSTLMQHWFINVSYLLVCLLYYFLQSFDLNNCKINSVMVRTAVLFSFVSNLTCSGGTWAIFVKWIRSFQPDYIRLHPASLAAVQEAIPTLRKCWAMQIRLFPWLGQCILLSVFHVYYWLTFDEIDWCLNNNSKLILFSTQQVCYSDIYRAIF